MSAGDIADNKWEVSAAKPPVTTIPAIAQILMMGVFAVIFVFMVVGAMIGSFSAKEGTYLEQKLEAERTGAAEEPAAAPEG